MFSPCKADYRFDGNALSSLKVEDTGGLISITSPLVSKLSTPPILRRSKRKRKVRQFVCNVYSKSWINSGINRGTGRYFYVLRLNGISYHHISLNPLLVLVNILNPHYFRCGWSSKNAPKYSLSKVVILKNKSDFVRDLK